MSEITREEFDEVWKELNPVLFDLFRARDEIRLLKARVRWLEKNAGLDDE